VGSLAKRWDSKNFSKEMSLRVVVYVSAVVARKTQSNETGVPCCLFEGVEQEA
jgi:hypothetical protein